MTSLWALGAMVLGVLALMYAGWSAWRRRGDGLDDGVGGPGEAAEAAEAVRAWAQAADEWTPEQAGVGLSAGEPEHEGESERPIE